MGDRVCGRESVLERKREKKENMHTDRQLDIQILLLVGNWLKHFTFNFSDSTLYSSVDVSIF